ncbi:F-type H+-transporting ATPase subunit delta [Burkholderiales bacterium]|nr:F-type H+-transporting ATPase subunit delta [Burkholderiales bacterium]
MAELTTVARPYAEAAFDIARGKNALPAWSTMLELVASVATDPRVSEALASPKLGDAEKESLFLSVCGERLDADARSLVRVLIESDRIGLAREIRELYEKRRNDAEGVARALIESALPVSDAELADLTSALQRRFGRRIEATVRAAPELIGGARITVGDTVIDASVQGRLAVMATDLTA